MKLVIILSVAALVACDHSTPEQGAPSSTHAFPEKVETIGGNTELGKPFFSFKNFYQGAYSPIRFPPTTFSSTFPSFNYPHKVFNYATSSQGILPPISQIIPPQISQIVPPISQIIPPIFGNAKPVFPEPSPIVPPGFSSQVLPPLPNQILNKITYPYYSPLYQFPYVFPSTFTLYPSTTFPTQAQKQPAENQPESLSNSYGPPASTPVDPEPAPAESSAPFEPSSVSFPYESAVAEAQESVAHHKPAQEYGLPPSK